MSNHEPLPSQVTVLTFFPLNLRISVPFPWTVDLRSHLLVTIPVFTQGPMPFLFVSSIFLIKPYFRTSMVKLAIGSNIRKMVIQRVPGNNRGRSTTGDYRVVLIMKFHFARSWRSMHNTSLLSNTCL